MKEIIYVNQTLGFGGAETFITSLLTNLKKHGLGVKVYTTNKSFHSHLVRYKIASSTISPIIDLIGDYKGLIKGILLLPIGLITYFILAINIKKIPGSLILMSGFIEKIILTPISKLLGIPVVWIEYGPLEAVVNKWLSIPKLLYVFASKYPNAIISPSKHSLKENKQYFKCHDTNLFVIPCGIPKPSKQLQLKNSKIVSCISRLQVEKRQDILINIWPEVIKVIPDAKLNIVGEGDQKEKLIDQIQKLNMGNNVKVLGWVNNLDAIYGETQVVVFPSQWEMEGFGLVQIEAMSRKRPVIAFATELSLEILGKSGILCKDQSQLASNIIDLINDYKKCKLIAEKGYKRFITHFDLNIVTKSYLQVLEFAYANRSDPDQK